MRYWWVNQNQTFEHEFRGGYLWSPKRNANGNRNPFYEFMREVSPGDIVFSFNQTKIPTIGIAQSHCYESPKPSEFGEAGSNWNKIGWKIEIRYFKLSNVIQPSQHMEILAPKLPPKYSPLQTNGRGLQGVYLTTVSPFLADALISLIGHEATQLIEPQRGITYPSAEDGYPTDKAMPAIIEWEDQLAQNISSEINIPETERETIIMARRGQGKFKSNVQKIENQCRITGVNKIEHLIASHCKPWRDCETHEERLDGENGLLLTPSIDHLFDRGFISFENNGNLLISPVAHTDSIKRMGIPVDQGKNVGSFSEGQKAYLEYHRESLFLESRVKF